ncbi:MAG: DinB family protein [Candidatus Zixiibacteriota bacterium]
MSYRENLLYMMKVNQQVLKRLVDDITEEESLEQGAHGHNHIRWQTGHLVHSNVFILKCLGEDIDDFGNYKELFGGGSKIADDPSVYPSLAELRAQLFELQAKSIAAAEKIPDADLEKGVDWGERKVPAWQSISFLCMHDFYHSGQIVNIRKILNREQPFG